MPIPQQSSCVDNILEIMSNDVSIGLPPKNNLFIRQGQQDLLKYVRVFSAESPSPNSSAISAVSESRALLNEHKTAILTVIPRLHQHLPSFRHLPSATMENGALAPRIVVLAQTYLRSSTALISSAHWVETIRALSLETPLSYAELVLVTEALQLAALWPLTHSGNCSLDDASAAHMQSVSALVAVLDFDSGNILEQLVAFEPLLCRDPAHVYPLLDTYSKRLYWDAVMRLAKLWSMPPEDVCHGAISLCARADVPADARQRLKAHIGYYLLDGEGVGLLRGHLGIQAGNRRGTLKRPSTSVRVLLYATLIATLALIAVVSSIPRNQPALWVAVITAALVIVAARTAEQALGLVSRYALDASVLPRVDLERGLPFEYTTIVALPSLLWSADAVDSFKERLKTHYAVIRDENVFLALLTDFPDCTELQIHQEAHAWLLEKCRSMLRDLNDLPEFSASKPFFLLHRNPIYSRTQRAWMGWERKRGKIQQLIALVVEGTQHFDHIVGDVERLRAARYMLVLDDHSELTDYSLHRLVGAAVHPLNHPYLDSTKRNIARGYGIIQPALEPRRLSSNAMNQGPLVRRDFYQDAFQQSGFWGKGLIHIETYHELLRGVIPEERILSHDVIETAFVRTASASEIRLLEGFPSNHSVACRRRHRWVRGDWQNFMWFLKLPRQLLRRTSTFGRLLVLENVRNSINSIAIMVLLLAGALFYPNLLLWCVLLLLGPGYAWIGIDVIDRMLRAELPTRRELYVATILIPKRAVGYFGGIAHEAAVSLDAIVRTLGRVATGRGLLEWEPSSSFARRMSSLNVCRLYRYVVPAVCGGIVSVLLWSGHTPLLLLSLLLWWSVYSLVAVK